MNHNMHKPLHASNSVFLFITKPEIEGMDEDEAKTYCTIRYVTLHLFHTSSFHMVFV